MSRRACGVRVQDGVYLEVGVGPNGNPIQDYFIDPVIPITPEQERYFKLTDIGVQVREWKGVYHAFNIVGQKSYKFAPDYLEEAARLGISTRVSSKLFEFEKLGEDSLLFVLHRKGFIKNLKETELASMLEKCPCAYKEHENPEFTSDVCIGHLWNAYPKELITDEGTRRVTSCEFAASSAPAYEEESVAEPPLFGLAIIAAFRISNIAVIEGKHHDETARKIREKTNYEVEIKKE